MSSTSDEMAKASKGKEGAQTIAHGSYLTDPKVSPVAQEAEVVQEEEVLKSKNKKHRKDKRMSGQHVAELRLTLLSN